MALRPDTAEGSCCALHAYPSLTEASTDFTPTAKQSMVLGHETEFSFPVPDGGLCAAQARPPVVVPMIVDPAPRLPVFPTPMQSSGSEHEIPVTSTALAGGSWSDQLDPLFDVVMTYGVELRLVPTAMQVVSFVQAMPDRRDPVGIEDGFVGVQSLKSTVFRLVAPPPSAMPTASHTNDPAHDTPVNTFTDGWSRSVQEEPSWVPTIDGRESTTPTATQVSESGQETLAREFKPAGGFWRFQVDPFDVPTISRPPTAVHSSIVKQETD
jgi:hypothetical protein